MATACLRACRFVFQRTKPITSSVHATQNQICVPLKCQWTEVTTKLVSHSTRQYSIYGKKSADSIWDSLTNVSSSGQKKGRSKNLMKRSNLYRGTKMGQGRSGMIFPGLSPVKRSERGDTEIRKGPAPNTDETRNLLQRRRQTQKKKTTGMDKGFTSKGLKGAKVERPVDIDDYSFEGFESRVLEWKFVANMTSNHGRKKQVFALVVTGNKNGLAGYAIGKANTSRSAIQKASNQAGQNLIYYDRFENRTVYHNFREHFHHTQVVVEKQEKGYGLVCHRVIKILARLVGLEDLHCKVEGRTKNYLSITKAFFNGLRKQETHQQLARRQQLHVVEYQAQRDDFPFVVASPQDKTRSKGDSENLDFDTLYYGKNIPYKRLKVKPFYAHYKSYKWKKVREHKNRNQDEASLERRVIFGNL